MSTQRWYLVFGTLIVLVSASFALAQSTPIARVTNGSGDWAPNEQNVSVSWSSENFGNTAVITGISLVGTTTHSLWSSGLTPGNYRSGSKTFNLTTTGSSVAIRLTGQSQGVTVPAGTYRLFVHIADNITRPTLEAEGYSSAFKISPNVSCPITINKTGQGTVTSGTSVPIGQAPSIFFSPATGYQTTSFQKCINGVCSPAINFPSSPKSLDTCVANSAGTAGVPLSAHVTFAIPGCPLNTQINPNPSAGTLNIPGLTNGKIPDGGSVTITATPNTGYTFREFTTPGTVSGNTTIVTCPTGSTATKSVSAFFVAGTCPVTGTAGTGGTISPASGTKNANQTQSFTARANAGYVINTLAVNGVAIPGVSGLTATTTNPGVLCVAPNPITASATFRPVSNCTITHNQGGPSAVGSISPTSGTTITSGNSQTITARAQNTNVYKYIVRSLTVAGQTTTAPANATTFTAPATCPATGGNIPVSAVFEPTACNLTARVIGEGGRISPEGSNNSVPTGTTGLGVIATPNTGYRITSFTVPGADNTIPTNADPMTKKALCTEAGSYLVAEVEFEAIIPCTLVLGSVGPGGALTKNPISSTIPVGGTASFTATAAQPGVIKDFTVTDQNGIPQPVAGAVGQTTKTKNITCPVGGGVTYTASASFARPCPLTIINGRSEGGTITPAEGSYLIAPNSSKTVSVQAKDGWVINYFRTGNYNVPITILQKTASRDIACGTEGQVKQAQVDFKRSEWYLNSKSNNPETGEISTGRDVTPADMYAIKSLVLFPGWSIEWVKIDGVSQQTTNPDGTPILSYKVHYDSSKLERNLEARLKFETWKINVVIAGLGVGRIDPPGSIVLVPGTNEEQKFQIIPETDSYIARVMLDNVDIPLEDSDMHGALITVPRAGKKERTLKVFFEEETCQFVFSASQGGSVIPTGSHVLRPDEQITVEAQSEGNYRFDKYIDKYYWWKNGGWVLFGTNQTRSNPETITCTSGLGSTKTETEAVFVPRGNGCPVSSNANAYIGKLIVPPSAFLNPGMSKTFKIVPDKEHPVISGVWLNNNYLGAVSTVDINCSMDPALEEAYQIHVEFDEDKKVGNKQSLLLQGLNQVASAWQAFGKLPDRVFGGMWGWLK